MQSTCGSAWNGQLDVTLETSLKPADAALYQAKNAGRNCVIAAAAG